MCASSARATSSRPRNTPSSCVCAASCSRSSSKAMTERAVAVHHSAPREMRSRTHGWLALSRPWVLPVVLLGLYEGYARRAAALGSEALAPPSAALKALVGAALDGSLWQ